MIARLTQAIAILSALLLAPRPALADDTVGNWTQAWTVGGAALSFNLRDGAITAADQGGSCYSLTNARWHVGGDLCLYFRLATKGLPNAFTPSIGVHYRQAGLGFGLMKSGSDPLAPVLRLTGQLPILGGS
jgi:hypothetical protein